MKSAPQDLLKEYVKSQQFTSTADIMQAMKEMFRDVIQQVMEVEMDEELGRERCQRSEEVESGRNYRMATLRRRSKRSWERLRSKFPEIERVPTNLRSSANMTAMQRAWRIRFSHCMPAV